MTVPRYLPKYLSGSAMTAPSSGGQGTTTGVSEIKPSRARVKFWV